MSLYLGTTPIASAMPSYSDIIDTLFPVGSCYIGTGSTCPLAAIKGTWTLQSSAVVTSVNTNVPVKGTGMSLGLTNGDTNVGSFFGYNSTLYNDSSAYGVDVGTSIYSTTLSNDKAVGVATDASKSGIVGTVTRSTLSVNIWQRTA